MIWQNFGKKNKNKQRIYVLPVLMGQFDEIRHSC